VVNAKSEKREEVRLWPTDREGRIVDVSVPPHRIHEAKVRTAVYEKIADEMADKIARLFYEYEVDQ
jgi:hypothetical protein